MLTARRNAAVAQGNPHMLPRIAPPPIVQYISRDLDHSLMLLPFRTRRFEKNNNNGERKQIKYEIKRIRVNERIKRR